MPADFPIGSLETYLGGEPLADGEVDDHWGDGHQVDWGGKGQPLYLDRYHWVLPGLQRAPAGSLLHRGF